MRLCGFDVRASRFLGLLLFSSVGLPFGCTHQQSVLVVGEHKLSKPELLHRFQQMRLLQNSVDQTEVLRGLIEGWASDQILEQRRQNFERDDLVAERAKLERNDKIRALYRQVQKIYGHNGEDFLEVGLLPDLSVRRLANAYETEGIGYEEAEKSSQAFLAAAQKAPDDFSSLAVSKGLSVLAYDADVTTGNVVDPSGKPIDDLAGRPDANQQAAKRLAFFASAVSDHTLLGLDLHTPKGYMLFKRESTDGKKIHLNSVLFAKIPFAQWLAEQVKAANLTVCIYDTKLRSAYEALKAPIALSCKP